MMNITKQRKVPHLVTMSADDKITLPGGSRYTFRTSNTLGMEQRMALSFTKDKKLKRIYGVTADYQATRDSWEWYRKEAEKAGVEIVGDDFPPLGNRDFSSIVDKIVDLTRFRRHMSASSTKLLECQRAQKVKMTVPADSIVETLDVIEHV